MSSKRGGRFGVEDPRRNIITFKVTDHEKLLLDIASYNFNSRSEMIRVLILDFALAIDPIKVLHLIDPEHLERLKEKIIGDNDEPV